jgi:acetate---CoA ligase (ADP-forming)
VIRVSSLARLVRPRSIAVIGGGFWCANVIEQCRNVGFSGPVWPVHPTRDTVGGLPAVRSIEDLPEAPDAAFIGVNRTVTVEAVRLLAERGAGGAVCFASGFRESVRETGDGDVLEAALVAAAGRMPILGPNCYGFLNLLDGAVLWPDIHGGVRSERGVALITQSSNIALNLTMQTRGLPLAYVMTVGNQAQTSMAEVALTLMDDDRVTALGLHIEGIGDVPAFEAMAARARALGKRIVAIKAGASDQARTAALSHTGALAGNDAGARALLDRLGIARVETLSQMLETLKLLHVAGPLASDRIASMSCSGGEAGLMADAAVGRDVDFPPLDDRQHGALRAALGAHVALANPLDYHTFIWGDRAAIARTFTAMMQGDLAMGVVVADFPRPDRCDGAAWEPVIEAVADTAAATGRPMAILATLPETMPETVAQRMIDRGIVPLCGVDDGLRAVEAAAWLGRPRPAAGPVLPARGMPTSPRLLSETEAKRRLAGYGVPVPRGHTVKGLTDLPDATAGLRFPLALKASGLAHKTEAGGVVLNLRDAQAVLAAARSMDTREFLIEEMIEGAGVELLVGVLRDPASGFLLTLGAGGVTAEIMQDTVSLLVPASRVEIDAALSGLRIAPLLDGYRGAPAVDRTAIVDVIDAVQDCVAALADELLDLEINPLIATPHGAFAVDALIELGERP